MISKNLIKINMICYCDVCDKTIKLESKNNQFKSNIHKEFDKCKHIKLTIENPNINNIDEIFYEYIIEHNKIHDFYPLKCEFEIIFNDNQYCPYITSNLSDNKTMISWSTFWEKVIDDFKDKGYNFNQLAEKNFITKANKWICHMISILNIICVI